MRKEEEKRAKSCSALGCDERVVEAALACDELVVGDKLPLPKLFECSHQVSQVYAHYRHNKDEVSSFEEYCEIIAKMIQR